MHTLYYIYIYLLVDIIIIIYTYYTVTKLILYLVIQIIRIIDSTVITSRNKTAIMLPLMAPGTFDIQCISGADVGFPPIKTRLYMHACVIIKMYAWTLLELSACCNNIMNYINYVPSMVTVSEN